MTCRACINQKSRDELIDEAVRRTMSVYGMRSFLGGPENRPEIPERWFNETAAIVRLNFKQLIEGDTDGNS